MAEVHLPNLKETTVYMTVPEEAASHTVVNKENMKIEGRVVPVTGFLLDRETLVRILSQVKHTRKTVNDFLKENHIQYAK